MSDQVLDGRRQNFFIIDDDVVRKLPLSIYTKMTYIVIVSHANKERMSRPARELIAKEGGMSLAAVKRSILESTAVDDPD